MIKVFNKETTLVEKIEVKDLDLSKHFHLNTHEAFTEEDLKLFGYKKQEGEKPEVKTKTK